ncbi:MAG: PDZ domain-containing protein [Acidobacteriota bacterium]|nr:PDZ domain-containing protein [Acidobacteriota bacterium]
MRSKLALLLLFLTFSAQAAEPFLRRPAIHGDTIAFTAEGDIWIAPLANGQARRLTTHEGTETSPRFSPDGSRIAFVGEYDGGPDLYVIDTAGGVPQRLTWDNDRDVRPVGWSADGKEITFRSGRLNGEWHNRLWSIAATGGLPKLLPVPRAEHAAVDASGQRVAFVPISAEWQHWKRYRGGQADDVWLADLATKSFRRITNESSIETTPVWIGNELFIASDRTGTSNLYRVDAASGQATAVTNFTDFDLLYPSSDGRRVVFEHGNGLGIYDPASNAVRQLSVQLTSDRIHARPRQLAAKENLQRAAIGPTGKRVLIEARGQIVSLPAGGEGAWRIVEATPGARAQYPAWSRDGKWIAFVSDRSGEEQVWLAPASGGTPARQLTKDHTGPLGPIVWSPDGKRLATSDREMRVLLVDGDSGKTTVVAQADRGGSYDSTVESYRFSPDGKWLAYVLTEPTWYQTVWLYDVARGTRTRLTSPSMDSYSPAFDPSGKYLYFLSRRDLRPAWSQQSQTLGFDKTARVSVIALAADTKPPLLKLDDEEGVGADAAKKDDAAKSADATKKSDADKKTDAAKKDVLPEVKVDLDGITDRIADVPVPGDRYASIVAVEDRLLVAIDTESGGGGGEPDRPRFQLRALSLKNPRKVELETVVEKMTSFDVSADGRKLLVRNRKDVSVGASDAAPLKEPDAIPLERVLLTVDPQGEWKQIFDETWRIARDFFYDPAMRGADWPAAKKKYQAQLANIGDRSELNIILGDLIAELNTGHSYVGGGDMPHPTAPATGRLGADFEPDPSGKAWRIARILPGDPYDLENRSPLLAPGVNVKAGDLIVTIDGRPVSTDRPVESMLVGATGRLVPIGISSAATGAPVRVVLVRPLANESRLRYYDWVAGRREYVRTHGGEKIVYVHMPNMSDRGMEEFAKQYYPDIPESDGVILDVRNNGGGWISANLLAQIADRPHTWFKPRYGASWTRATWATPGYRVAMCDDQSYSNAEEFCDAFQRMKLGPVVGSRSWGGEVGSGNGYPLIDGGLIFIPNYGAWSPKDGWIIEGRGVVPDIEVEQDPASLLAGRDPQLDRAIAHIKEQIAKKPVEHPVPPPHAAGVK